MANEGQMASFMQPQDIEKFCWMQKMWMWYRTASYITLNIYIIIIISLLNTSI